MPVSPVTTSRPSFIVNGVVRSDLSSALISMDVSENWISGKSAEIELTNWGPVGESGRPGFPFFVEPIRFGDLVSIKVENAVLIEGIVTAIEGQYEKGEFPVLCVTISQEIVRMDNAVRTRRFEEVSLQDLVSSICDEYGFTTEFLGDGSEPILRSVVQCGETDLEFLGQVLEEADLYLSFEDKVLRVSEREASSSTTFNLNPNGKLYSYTVRADVYRVPTQLESRLFDGALSEVSIASADSSDLPTTPSSALSGPAVSASVWESVTDELPEPRLGADGLQLATTSRFNQAAREFLVGEGEAEFDAALALGSKINFSGLGKPFNGRAIVSAVSHRFDLEDGLRTCFETERFNIGEDLASIKKAAKKKRPSKRKKVPTRKPSSTSSVTAAQRLVRRRVRA